MPDRDRRHRVHERPAEAHAVERAPRRDVDAGDRGAARAAVGLEDVAVEPQRALAERLEVDHGAQRPADQPLDLDGPALLLARARLARRPLRRSTPAAASTRPSASPCRGPASSAARPPRSWRCRARASALSDQSAEPCGCSRKSGSIVERPQLVRSAGPSVAAHAAASELGDGHVLDLVERQLEEALAEARNAPGSPVVRKR